MGITDQEILKTMIIQNVEEANRAYLGRSANGECLLTFTLVPPNDPKKLYGRKSYPVFYSFSKWQIVTVFPQQLSLLDHAYLKVKLNFSKQRTSKMEFSPAH